MKEATIKININTQNAINSIDELNNEFNGTLSTIGDLRIASDELSKQLESTPVGTAKFQELQQSLIDVNGQIKNYELSIEALDNEQLASEIRSVVGGVMDLAGGFVLLGASKESMEVIAQKFAKIEGISRAATGAMDIFNSGTKVMNSILTKSAAAQGVMATATNASGVASAGAAVKFRALTAAMLSNPLAAIAVAVLAVVSALILFGDESEASKEKQDDLNSSLDKQLDTFDDLDNALNKYNNNLQRYYESVTDDEETLLQVKLNALDTERNTKLQQLTELEKDVKKATGNTKLEYQERIKNLQAFLFDEIKETNAAGFEAVLFSNQTELEKYLIKKKYENDKNELTKASTIKEKEEYQKRLDDYNKYLEMFKAMTLKNDDDIKNLSTELSNYGEEENVLRLTSLENARNRELDLTIRAYEMDKLKLDENLANKTISQEKYNEDLLVLQKQSYEKALLITENALNKGRDILTDIQNEEVTIVRETNKVIGDSNLELYKKTKRENLEEADGIKEKAGIIASYYGDLRVEIEDFNKFKQEELEVDYEYENGLLEDRAKRLVQDLKDGVIDQEQYSIILKKIIAERDLVEKKYNYNRRKLSNDTSDALVQNEKDMYAEIAQLNIEAFNKFGSWLNAISGPLTQFTDILNSAFTNMNDTMQKSIDKAYDSGTEMYNKMYGEQLISREEYDNKIEILDQEKREKEKQLARKAFNQQKATNIINATMQGAQAVLSSFAAGASIPPLGPITTGPLFAGIAGALAATQIGIISAQKFKASRGGKVPGMSSKVDSVDALLAPGEMVINSTSSDMFAPILSAINQAGGGVPLAPSDMLSQSNSTEKVYSENKGNNVVKAYVVESELTSTQRRVDRFKNNATF
jgi:hypothetical protein